MTALEIELLAGLRATFSALKVYEPEGTAFHREIERILGIAAIKESRADGGL